MHILLPLDRLSRAPQASTIYRRVYATRRNVIEIPKRNRTSGMPLSTLQGTAVSNDNVKVARRGTGVGCRTSNMSGYYKVDKNAVGA